MEYYLSDSDPIVVSPEKLAEIFSDYYKKRVSLFNETLERSRYAVEVEFRTTMDEASFGFAKIALGYVSSALKKMGYHVKLVFSEKPLRVIVSSRNWDDGEWVGMISYNTAHNTFVLSKGHYNKSDKSVTVKSSTNMSKPFSGQGMSEKLKSTMEDLKKLPTHKRTEINIHLKRGPKT
jgi:Txe/YoeB family toxin of Txe-Axe toxin-antitoxin module